MKKLVWYLLAAVFLLSAALQFNDPDPLYWSVAYSAAALACARFAIGSGPRTLVWLVLGVTLAGVLSTAPGFAGWLREGGSLTADMGQPYVEQAREFIGIGVASVALIVGLKFSR